MDDWLRDLAKASPNFGVLYQHQPLLALYGAQAELNVFSNPNAAQVQAGHSLLKGRLDAYRTAGLFLTQWRDVTHRGQHGKARDVVRIAWDRPLADVPAAMFHQSALPVAESLFDGEGDVLELLCDPSVREGFLGGA